MASVKEFETVDLSDKITTCVFSDTSIDDSAGSEHNNIQVNVEPDMVVVGGGGVVSGPLFYQHRAYLTASFPNEERTAWIVSSRDHNLPYPHVLTGYAIGLRIDGMSRERLLSALHFEKAISAEESHPEATATLPGTFKLISGGFRITTDGPGSLVTASYPVFQESWTARAKDHLTPSPAIIETWAIGLRYVVLLGEDHEQRIILVNSTSSRSPVSRAPSASTQIPPWRALTGIGAEVSCNPHGSLINQLAPNGPLVMNASANDHQIASPAAITAWAIGITCDPEQP